MPAPGEGKTESGRPVCGDAGQTANVLAEEGGSGGEEGKRTTEEFGGQEPLQEKGTPGSHKHPLGEEVDKPSLKRSEKMKNGTWSEVLARGENELGMCTLDSTLPRTTWN